MSLTAPLLPQAQEVQPTVSPWPELFEQVQWLSPQTYCIANHKKSVAEPEALLPALAEDVYRHLFLRLPYPDAATESSAGHSLLISHALGGTGLESAKVEDPAFQAEWSAAKRRRLAALSEQLRPLLKPLWQSEWQRLGRDRGPDRWARKNGIVFQLSREEIRGRSIQRPFSRPKNQLSQVRIPAERLNLFPGFYFVQQGDPQTGLMEEIDPEPVLRLYWNTDPLARKFHKVPPRSSRWRPWPIFCSTGWR